MSFITPLALLLGLLALPIVLLYMLRLRRREMLVSSTLLWEKLLRDREANAPWQRLRRNLLLLLQLLILAALVFALARPFLPVPSVVSGNVVVLLDASASMQATDVAPGRFAVARDEVDEIIGNLGGGDQMTLIRVGHTPEVLAAATGDRQLLRAALDGAAPGSGTADWAAAFGLAAGAAQGFRDARVVVVSDGGLPADLPPLPGEVIYLPIGESGENLAVTALATRQGVGGIELFVSVRNHGLVDQEALLDISLDGTLFDARRIAVPAGESSSLTWALPDGTSVVHARLSDLENDHLALDNEAWAVHQGGLTNRTLLVTAGNLFLEQVYAVLPDIDAFRVGPTADVTGEGSEPFDLYVFDGVPLPDPLPDGDLLLINPQPGGEESLLRVSGVFSNTTVTRIADSPLLSFVDWAGVNILQAQQVEAPWMETLVAAEGGALVLTGERLGRRVAVISFDLRQSDLPLRVAFPILMANITDWLSPGTAFDARGGLQPGDTMRLAPAATTRFVAVTQPDGSVWREEVGEEELIFGATRQLGLYQVLLQDDITDQPAGRFAVNLFAPQESALAPADALRIGQAETVAAATRENVGQLELWPWLAAVALLVLVVEWWVYHQGARLPRLPQRLRRSP